MTKASLARRRALLLLGGGMMLPRLARAQETPPAVPATPTPPVPPRPVPPTPPASPGAVDKTKAYYLFFQQGIDPNTMKLLRNQLTTLVEGGVTEITLVISSQGGLVVPALLMYSLIRALPAKINTHAQGFVQSAANILFLAGAERGADDNVKFLFHPSQSGLNGLFDGQQIEQQLGQLHDIDEAMARIYRDRTSLPETEIQRYQHETITYDAEAALKYGIIQSVGSLQIPGEQKAKLVFIE